MSPSCCLGTHPLDSKNTISAFRRCMQPGSLLMPSNPRCLARLTSPPSPCPDSVPSGAAPSLLPDDPCCLAHDLLTILDERPTFLLRILDERPTCPPLFALPSCRSSCRHRRPRNERILRLSPAIELLSCCRCLHESRFERHFLVFGLFDGRCSDSGR